MAEDKKITKQGCSKKFMKTFFENGLAEKTITKKAFNEWKKTVKTIEDGEGTEAEKLKEIKGQFYDTFIKAQQKKKVKSTHPLYDMFNEIGKDTKTEKKDAEETEKDTEEE